MALRTDVAMFLGKTLSQPTSMLLSALYCNDREEKKMSSNGNSQSDNSSFRKYCESTSLHGWQYIYRGKAEWRLFWAGMVLSSVVVAFFFVFKQASEFTKATVVTTVDTTTAPLEDVYFPSVTVCNINQVRFF